MDDTIRMTPLEAMTVLVHTADTHMSLARKMGELSQMDAEQRAAVENIEMAISVITALLNTALPIARFRCFVQVEAMSRRRGGMIRDDYTICAPTVDGILAGLIGLHHAKVDVHATLWEQRPLGAEMLSGYQGPTKVTRYRSWVESLLMYREDAHAPTPSQDSVVARTEEAGEEDPPRAEEERRGNYGVEGGRDD